MTRNVVKQFEEIISSDMTDFKAPLSSAEATLVLDPELKHDIEVAIEATRDGYKKFLGFFQTEYLPCCKDEPGLSVLPHGIDMYQTCLQYHTTTDMSPNEVHEVILINPQPPYFVPDAEDCLLLLKL